MTETFDEMLDRLAMVMVRKTELTALRELADAVEEHCWGCCDLDVCPIGVASAALERVREGEG